MYYIRLDDASIFMKEEAWNRMENILDKYNIKPIFGIIPCNEDPDLMKYGMVDNFWERAHSWIRKGWIPALHGCTHVFETECAGINPVNRRSEFAGVSLERQQEKVAKGIAVLKEHNINADIFFAPAHTFDNNTLMALKSMSKIRIISDTIAHDMYYSNDFYFIPQQSGHAVKLPFKTVTICYHPNTMSEEQFVKLETFLNENSYKFGELKLKKRKLSIYDKLLQTLYFAKRIQV